MSEKNQRFAIHEKFLGTNESGLPLGVNDKYPMLMIVDTKLQKVVAQWHPLALYDLPMTCRSQAVTLCRGLNEENPSDT